MGEGSRFGGYFSTWAYTRLKNFKTSNLTPKLKKTPNKRSLCGLYLIACPGSRSPCSGMQRFLALVISPKARFLRHFLGVHLRQEVVVFMDSIAERVSGPLLCVFLFTGQLCPHSSRAGRMMGPIFSVTLLKCQEVVPTLSTLLTEGTVFRNGCPIPLQPPKAKVDNTHPLNLKRKVGRN